MKRFALCLMVLFGFIITYYHPKPGTNLWEADIYKTEQEPKLLKGGISQGTVSYDVWGVKLDDKTVIYLPAQWTTVKEEKPEEKKE